jgi:methionyl-tRNA formyltransferase
MKEKVNYIFFGTGPLAESVLFSLYKNNIIPKVVVTKPDAKAGRDHHIESPHIKTWCELKGIQVYQPEDLKSEEVFNTFKDMNFDLAIVASYGKIIPKNILDLPKYGFLNVHPSTLPEFRGPSPIESQILAARKEIGITIMKLNEKMDAGEILVQSKIFPRDIATIKELEIECGQAGGELLSQVLDYYLMGNLKLIEQDNSQATICKFVRKEMGEIKLTDNINEIKNKYRAYYGWPGIYFFHIHNDKQIRVKITKINLEKESDNILDIIEKVIPEGKSEMTFEEFQRGYFI